MIEFFNSYSDANGIQVHIHDNNVNMFTIQGMDSVYADGHELEALLTVVSNLPRIQSRSVTWDGELAKRIITNFAEIFHEMNNLNK